MVPRKKIKSHSLLSILILGYGLLLSSTAYATNENGQQTPEPTSSPLQALFGGELEIEERYRFEHINEDGFTRNANASTLRSQWSYRTQNYLGVLFELEYENTARLGKKRFNDTTNGLTQFPTITDPSLTQVNEMFLEVTAIPDTFFRVGRQNFVLGNGRHVGLVDYRQNDQSADAIAGFNTSIPGVTFVYGHFWQANMPPGKKNPAGEGHGEAHIVSPFIQLPYNNTLQPFMLHFDMDGPPGGLDILTYGLHLDGKQKVGEQWSFPYQLEATVQKDIQENPNDFKAYYFMAEASAAYEDPGYKALFTIGFERFTSDNGLSFQAPMASQHEYNGNADLFVTIPGQGLDDLYVEATYTREFLPRLGETEMYLGFHHFSSEANNTTYGNEVDLALRQALGPYLLFEAEYSHYDANSFGNDQSRFAGMLRLRKTFSFGGLFD